MVRITGTDDTPWVRENCGVVGIFSNGGINVVPLAIDALRAVQHRGQEAWGIAVPDRKPLRRMGLVSASSSDFHDIAAEYESECAIGHVRYSTIGRSNLENAQPHRVQDLCVAHNGTITDAAQLQNMVGGCTFSPPSSSDTLMAAQRLVSLMDGNSNMANALRILKSEMAGSYCFTFISDDHSVYAARDARGFRPWCWATGRRATPTWWLRSRPPSPRWAPNWSGTYAPASCCA